MSGLLVVKLSDRQVEILMDLLGDRYAGLCVVQRSADPLFDLYDNGELAAPPSFTDQERQEIETERLAITSLLATLGGASRE
jgi:hypothetical protein